MAYFSNSSEGECLENKCYQCRYGEKPCPIFAVQFNYNYDACGNKVASQILNDLINDDGTCEMYKMFEKDFALTEGEKTQLDLF